MSLATQLRSNISSETGQRDVFKRDLSRSRNSSRTHCENPSRANLLMQYALQLGKPLLAAIERIFTTLDPGGIREAKCCVNINGAVIFTPTVCSHSIVVISVNGFTTATPALFTSKSIGPFPTSAMRSETPGGFARS